MYLISYFSLIKLS